MTQKLVRTLEQARAEEDWSRLVMQEVLGLPAMFDANQERDPTRRLELLGLVNRAELTLARYRAKLGANAFAVFAAMAELADTLPGARGFHRDRKALRRSVGNWATEFCRGLRAVGQRTS